MRVALMSLDPINRLLLRRRTSANRGRLFRLFARQAAVKLHDRRSLFPFFDVFAVVGHFLRRRRSLFFLLSFGARKIRAHDGPGRDSHPKILICRPKAPPTPQISEGALGFCRPGLSGYAWQSRQGSDPQGMHIRRAPRIVTVLHRAPPTPVRGPYL